MTVPDPLRSSGPATGSGTRLQPGRRAGTSRGSRVGSVIIALACIVVAGIGVNITKNISSDVIRTANVHQRTRLDNAFVTVTRVRAGTAVSDGTDQRYRSGGMILGVTVRAEAPGTSYTIGGLGGATVHAAGRTYSAFGPNESFTAEAGFVSTGEILFEVDPRHIAGAYLQLYHDEIFYATPQKVHIRLGITQQNAAQWAASAQGRTLQVATATSKPIP